MLAIYILHLNIFIVHNNINLFSIPYQNTYVNHILPDMHFRSTVNMLIAGLSILLLVAQTSAIPPPICNEQKAALTPYAQKLCSALSNISEFSRAMEEYLDEKR